MKLDNMRLLGEHHFEPHYGGGPMSLKFELGLDFLTMHLPTKFHHPMFNRSDVIVLRSTQTHKQTKRDSDESIHLAQLCYADERNFRFVNGLTACCPAQLYS